MTWALTNWETIFATITGIVTAFSVLAKVTKTKTDDKYLGYVLKIINVLAISAKPIEIKKK